VALVGAGRGAGLGHAVGPTLGWQLGEGVVILLAAGSGLIGGALVFLLRRWPRTTAIALVLAAVMVPFVEPGLVVPTAPLLRNKPIELTLPQVTEQDKRDLAERLADHAELHRSEGKAVTLSLTEQELRLGLAWASQLSPAAPATEASLGEQAIRLRSAQPWARGQHLNVSATFAIQADQPLRRLRLASLQIGYWRPGPRTRRLVTAAMHDLIRWDPKLRDLPAAMTHAKLTRTEMTLRYRPDRLPPWLAEPFGATPDAGMRQRVIAHARHLIEAPGGASAERARLIHHISRAFAFARQRTAAGSDPIRENRAALYALTLLDADQRLGPLIGVELPEALLAERRRRHRRLTLRGRHDLARHLLISATLAMKASEGLSEAAGLLKEQVDAGADGSGFSFVDLLADRAGTRLAKAATRDPASARRVQNILAQNPEVAAIFPETTGLPEGLRGQRWQSLTSLRNDPQFQKLQKQITQRLNRCAALQ
jgi:hypothetical protein